MTKQEIYKRIIEVKKEMDEIVAKMNWDLDTKTVNRYNDLYTEYLDLSAKYFKTIEGGKK